MRKLFRRIRAWYLMWKMDRYMTCLTRKPGIPARRFYRNALKCKKLKLGPWKEV